MSLPHPARSHLLAIAALVAVVAVATTVLYRVNRDHTDPATPYRGPAPNVVVHLDRRGAAFDPAMQGLSFEMRAILDPTFSDTRTTGALVDHLRALGKGTMRIAANDADTTFWTQTDEPAPAWAKATVTPKAIDDLARVAKRSGWSVVLGVNFKHHDPRRAADQIAYARHALGKHLTGVAVVNEPEMYRGSDAAGFTRDLHSYVEAIHQVAPSIAIYGPDVQIGGPLSNAVAEAQVAQRDVDLWSRHFYPTNHCAGATTNVGALLSESSARFQQQVIDKTVSQARHIGVPAVISETNTVACEGQPGVSDTMASSLWALDYTLQAGRAGVTGVMFHGSVDACGGTHGYKAYAPLCAPDIGSPRLRAQPEQLGLLALRQIGGGSFVDVDSKAGPSIRTYAIDYQGHTTFVAINVADPKSRPAPQLLDVDLGKRYDRARASKLAITSADGLAATTGITIDGVQPKTDGRLPKRKQASLAIDGRSLHLELAPASATIVTLD